MFVGLKSIKNKLPMDEVTKLHKKENLIVLYCLEVFLEEEEIKEKNDVRFNVPY